MPDAFFKYMTYSTANIVLDNQTLRWSTPATLNDPYDIQFDLSIKFDREKVLRDTLEKLWKVHLGELKTHPDNKMSAAFEIMRPYLKHIPKKNFMRDMEIGIRKSFSVIDENIQRTYRHTRDQLSTTKILCLTDSPINQLMWAYYADSNKGVVLRFQNEPGADSPYTTAQQMSYIKEIPLLFEDDELSDFLSGIINFDQAKRINTLIYTKSDAWKHENEWRIFSGDGRTKDAPHEDVRFAAKELTGVIFGCRMLPDQRSVLASKIGRLYPHAEILQATPASHSFQLELSSYVDP
ncbi:DUF2971 domain-containing protein [Pseudomonas sp. SWRI81]|uniref:DUF2971 domain-containing protein n=1 Tax=Pseudomonas sp. SWRI81 TaxID=2745505 RepID=UPI001646C031|nr:DUF2971 domain-containing protein [Pseudomonas sp. SWRI81]MBC3272594.1 DUF2971 domain-containing protein [Pseudomonas sp. SWRI81]